MYLTAVPSTDYAFLSGTPLDIELQMNVQRISHTVVIYMCFTLLLLYIFLN